MNSRFVDNNNIVTDRSAGVRSITSSPINDQLRYAANPGMINQDIELQQNVNEQLNKT